MFLLQYTLNYKANWQKTKLELVLIVISNRLFD